MNRAKLGAIAAFAGVALFLVAGGATAGPTFAGLTSTAGGYHTWDLDQINVENVSETGAGVCVPVIDMGLVPNYRDYFPDARVADELGTGFEQRVRFSP